MYLAYQESQNARPVKKPAAKTKRQAGITGKSTSPAPDTSKPANPPATTTTPAAASGADGVSAQPGTGTSGTLVPEKQPQVQMTTFLWIGVVFTSVLLVFIMFTIYIPPPKGSQGRAGMKVLSALCCGFAGGFLTGAALFNATWGGPIFKVSLSGSAGMALFFTVFFFLYEKVADGDILSGGDGVFIDIAPGWKLRDVVDTITRRLSCGADYNALTADELNAAMKVQPLKARTVENLFSSLRYLTLGQTVRPYTVVEEDGSYIFKVKEQ